MNYPLYLSLGSNIEPRVEYLRGGLGLLNNYFVPVRISSLYETEPVDMLTDDHFYNICALYISELSDPQEILNILKNIEAKKGRQIYNKGKNKSRTLDIDILLFHDIIISTDALHIPHKRMYQRRFVLEPLLEILPKHSQYYKKTVHALEGLHGQKIKKLGDWNFGFSTKS